MKRDDYKAFIRSSLFNILRDGVFSTNALGKGIETFAIHEYFLQSLFLRMTGAQEQKIKCIRWEIATDDLVYRENEFYVSSSSKGCSTLKSKEKVYSKLLEIIKINKPNFKLFEDIKARQDFCDDIYQEIKDIFDNTNIVISQQQKYESFKKLYQEFNSEDITVDNKLFKDNSTYTRIYELLYNERNRCAHNATSYQINLPTLKEFRDEKFQKNNNIFLFYAVLLLIDKIFVRLFEKYENLEKIM